MDAQSFFHARSNRWLRSAALVAAIMLTTGSAGAQPDPPPGRHGMLVLGTKGKVYLLHLATRSFEAHRFQLILEVELAAGPDTRIDDRTFVGRIGLGDRSANEVYFLDRNASGIIAPLYTLRPREEFVLTEIPKGERARFRGDIVRGHFEHLDAAPATLLGDVEVRVARIIYFQDLRQLAADAPHPLTLGKLQFRLFGANGEYFLTHEITLHGQQDKPDNNGFHQVFPVTAATAERLAFDGLARTVEVEIPAASATDLGRLPEGGGAFSSRIQGLIRGVDLALPVEIEVGPEHYLEVLF